MTHFNGQYYAGEAVGPRMQDIAADVKRTWIRTAVGDWELEKGFSSALAADDERDRRAAMRVASDPAPHSEPIRSASRDRGEERILADRSDVGNDVVNEVSLPESGQVGA